jgi:hypothetical protein
VSPEEALVRGFARVSLATGLLALVLVWSGGCASGPVAWYPGNLQPLVVGWQQFFRIQWDATTYDGQPAVEGYITNVFGFTALNVRVLINGYDTSGQQVGQLISWGPNEIDFGGRVYFIVPVPPAATYDVSIFSWNWVQTGNGADLR